MRSSYSLLFVFSGSLLFQVVQIGAYPILIAQILSDKSVDKLIIGCFLAISWIVILLLGPAAPKIIERLGAGRANGAAFFLTAASLVLLIVWDGFTGLFVSAFSMGLGLIIRWINCDSLVVRLSRAETRGRMIGLHEALMGLGIGLGPLLFAVLSLSDAARACIGLAILGQIAFCLSSAGGRLAGQERQESQGAPFRYRMLALVLAAAFVAGFIENSAIALFPLYFEDLGYSLGLSAILVSAFGFGGTLLQPPLGYVADRLSHRFAQRLCAAVTAAACLAIAAFPTGVPIVFTALFLLGGAAGGLNTLAVIEAGKTINKAHIPAAMTAIAMLYTLGSVMGPVASGLVLELFKNHAMLILFAVAALGLGGFDLAGRSAARRA